MIDFVHGGDSVQSSCGNEDSLIFFNVDYETICGVVSTLGRGEICCRLCLYRCKMYIEERNCKDNIKLLI